GGAGAGAAARGTVGRRDMGGIWHGFVGPTTQRWREGEGPAGIERECREPQASDGGKDSPGLKEPHHWVRLLQARQESNLQPPVLETGALPIELRTSEY